MELTEFKVQKCISGLWSIRNVTFPNVDLFGWEMDLALVSTSNYLTEVEIKLSKSDWKRDIEKKKWQWNWMIEKREKYIKKFYYAIPDYLLGDIPPFVCKSTGLVIINEGGKASILREAETNKECKKLEERMVTNLYSKMYYRNPWWNKGG